MDLGCLGYIIDHFSAENPACTEWSADVFFGCFLSVLRFQDSEDARKGDETYLKGQRAVKYRRREIILATTCFETEQLRVVRLHDSTKVSE